MKGESDWVATHGALPRFRLRRAYGATRSEADRGRHAMGTHFGQASHMKRRAPKCRFSCAFPLSPVTFHFSPFTFLPLA